MAKCKDHPHEPFKETDRSRSAGFKWRCPYERRDHRLKQYLKQRMKTTAIQLEKLHGEA